jgi:ribosomal protein L31
VNAPAASNAPASGAITVANDAVTPASFSRRNPQFIPAGSFAAHLWIDSATAVAASTTCTSSLCTIAYSTTAGTHKFVIDVDSSSHVVAAGTTGFVSVFSGTGNNFSLSLNGATAMYVASADSCGATLCGQTFGLEGPSAAFITGTAFDTGTVTLSVVTDTGTNAGYISGTSAFSSPCAGGNAYLACVGCNSTGTFHLTATNGTPGGIAGITAVELTNAGLSYSSITGTTYEYTCTGTAISDAAGTIIAS